jgi:hypothetical protein
MRKQIKLLFTSLGIVSAMLCHGQSVETPSATAVTNIETKQQIQVLDSMVCSDQRSNDGVKEPTTVCNTNINSTANVKRLSNSLITAQFRNPAHQAMYKKDYFALVSSTFYLQRKLYASPYWFI